MLKAVIWDNGGVLVDTERLYFRATRNVLSGVGVDLTRDLFVQISLKQGRSTFDLAVAQGVEPEVIARLRADRNRRYSDLMRNGVRVLDGVEDTLRQLQGKVLMGVVTNSRREHFELIHTTTGLLQYFDFVLTREGYGKSKPNPDPFLTAIIRNGLQPEHCIIVEDSERGFDAAKAADAGIKMCGTASTIWGSPTGSATKLEDAVEFTKRWLEIGAYDIEHADHDGSATAADVYRYFSMTLDEMPDTNLHVAHFHETKRVASASVLAALQAGITCYEATFGGLGGQPSNFLGVFKDRTGK